MRNKLILGICFTVGTLCAAPAIYAGEGKGNGKGDENRSAKATQVQIDKATGRKISGSDSSAEINSHAAAIPAATGSALLPAQSGALVYHANGSVSAQVGQEHMKYLVMSIDENGERSFSHQSIESVESGVAPVDHNVEEK